MKIWLKREWNRKSTTVTPIAEHFRMGVCWCVCGFRVARRVYVYDMCLHAWERELIGVLVYRLFNVSVEESGAPVCHTSAHSVLSFLWTCTIFLLLLLLLHFRVIFSIPHTSRIGLSHALYVWALSLYVLHYTPRMHLNLPTFWFHWHAFNSINEKSRAMHFSK